MTTALLNIFDLFPTVTFSWLWPRRRKGPMKARILPVLLAAAILAAPASAQNLPAPGSDEAVRQAERGLLYTPPPQPTTYAAAISFPQFRGYLIVAAAGRQYEYLDSCHLSPPDIKTKHTMSELRAFGGEIVWVIIINKKHNAGVGASVQQAQKICQQP
jgi:hypothetical protein